MVARILGGLRSICTVDLRSLAVMRILIAVTLLIDLTIRLFNLKAHYTDQGILPLEALFRYGWNGYYYSVYTMCTLWPLQAIIFAINFIFIGLLLLGYRTRLSTFVCWFFLLSIHNRNPIIHQGGDDLLRLILFLGMFLPWATRYSIDASSVKSSGMSVPKVYTSIIILAYIMQVMYVYVFSALLKTSSEWDGDYSALYYAFSFDQIVLPLGKLLYPYEGLLQIATAVVFYIELLLPFLLLLPFFTNFFRTVFICVLLLFHVGISLTLNVGIFPLIALVSLAALIPGTFWDYLANFAAIQNFKQSFTIRSVVWPIHQLTSLKDGFIKTNLIIMLIFYTLAWNLGTAGKTTVLRQAGIEWIGPFLRIDQHWGMFAPSVFKDDGWFIFTGELKNGKILDVMNNSLKLSDERKEQDHPLFHSDRWRKYAENFLLVVNGHYRPYFCFYLMNQWDEQHKEPIKKLEIFYVKEVSLPDYKVGPAKKEMLCNCQRND